MKTFLIRDNDLVFGPDMNLLIAEGPQEETQSIERALTTDINEWFLHGGHGLDYSYILTKQFDEERARLEVIATIMQDPRVQSVQKVEFDFSRPERQLAIYFEAKMNGKILSARIVSSGHIVPVVDDGDASIQHNQDYQSINDNTQQILDLRLVTELVTQEIDYQAI